MRGRLRFMQLCFMTIEILASRIFSFIAATCLVHDIPVSTSNKRHFSRVPGLRVITSSELLSD